MASFTRLAIIALTGMSGRLLWRRRRKADARARRKIPPVVPEPIDAGTAVLASPASQTSLTPAPDPPVNHFRQLSARPDAPRLATVAARSLPVLGILGLIATVALTIGALQGELPYLGPIDGANPAWAAAMVTIAIWAAYLLWKVPQWQAAAWAKSGNSTPRELFEIENESRGTLGQILSGVAVLTGLIFAWQQLGQTNDNIRVSEERQITDRFTKAVDQLGSESLTVRLGGIYALERIARDSPTDYGPVMEVLTAFARQESPLPANAAATPVVAAPPLSPDVAAVLKVIGRRTPEQVERELKLAARCLDLTGMSAVGATLVDANLRNTCWDGSDLRAAQLTGADLTQSTFVSTDLSQQAGLGGINAQGATFSNADFTGSELSRADFSEANLQAADLSYSILQETNLAEANLIRANMQGAQLIGTDLSGANLLDADFTLALVTGADLADAEHLTAEQVESAAIISDTSLPPHAQASPAP